MANIKEARLGSIFVVSVQPPISRDRLSLPRFCRLNGRGCPRSEQARWLVGDQRAEEGTPYFVSKRSVFETTGERPIAGPLTRLLPASQLISKSKSHKLSNQTGFATPLPRPGVTTACVMALVPASVSRQRSVLSSATTEVRRPMAHAPACARPGSGQPPPRRRAPVYGRTW